MDSRRARHMRSALVAISDAARARESWGFAGAILPSLRRLVPSESLAYNELDVDRSRVSWISDPDDAARRAYKPAFEEFAWQHPMVAYHARTHDPHALQMSDFLSQTRFRRLELYSTFYKDLEIDYQLQLTLEPSRSLFVAFSFCRKTRDFDPRERAMLDFLRPYLVSAYREADARQTIAELLNGGSSPSLAVAMLDASGAIDHVTGDGRRWLDTLVDGRHDELERWMSFERGAGDADLPRLATPLTIRCRTERLDISLIPDAADGRAALLLVHRGPNSGASLSAREAEVMDGVRRGLTNAQVAEKLFISTRTVQKHLERIYEKLGVHSRTAALAALDQLGGGSALQ